MGLFFYPLRAGIAEGTTVANAPEPPSPLVRAAQELEDELRRCEDAVADAAKARLNTEKSIGRAARALKTAAGHREQMGAKVNALVAAIQEARGRADAAAARMEARAGEIQARMERLNALQARVYEGAEPVRASAYPYWWNPFRWFGVVETQNFYALTVVDSLGPEVDPDGDMRIRYKPEETPVTLAAKRSYLGRVYLDWAQYPVTETEEIRNPRPGYVVQFQDLRFAYPERRGANLLRGGVVLDRNLNVVAETFGSRGKQLPD